MNHHAKARSFGLSVIVGSLLCFGAAPLLGLVGSVHAGEPATSTTARATAVTAATASTTTTVGASATAGASAAGGTATTSKTPTTTAASATAAAPAATGGTAGTATAGTVASGELRFGFSSVKDKGIVRCALYATAQDYLKKSFREATSKVEAGRATCVFPSVPAGTYSMGAFHDENNNDKLDTGIFGIPVEGICTSNNAKGRFGPPKYKDASFVFTGAAMTQELRMIYR